MVIALTLVLSLAFVTGLAGQGGSKLTVTQIEDNVTNASISSTTLGDGESGVVVYYFWAIGCSHCAALEPWMDALILEYPEVTFYKLEIAHNTTNYYLFLDFNAAFHTGTSITPTAFIENERAFIGDGPIQDDLEAYIVQLINAVAPSAPQNLSANAGNGNIVLTWSAPTNDGGATITGYKVYRGTTPGGEGVTPIATLGIVLTYTDTGRTNGVTYYYKVCAVNIKGDGTRSIEDSATPVTLPAAPVLTSATSGNAQVVLVWTAPSSNGGSAITNYRIYCGVASGSEVLIDTVGNVLTYTDTGLTNGQIYYYKIRAVNGVGDGPQSNELSSTPATVPTEPQSLVADAKNGYVVLTWSAPANNGGATITGYKVYRGTTSGGQGATPIATLSNVLTFNNTGLTNGATYYYKVSAVNSKGEGVKSIEGLATPLGTPTAVQNIQASPGDAYIVLTWNAPASNGGNAITKYGVWRGTSPGTETYLADAYPNLEFNDTGVTNDQTYYYTVKAENVQGIGPTSSEVSATPSRVKTVSTAPESLTATAGNGRIVLNWTVPVNNGGASITGYKIYRSTTAGNEALYRTLGNTLTLVDQPLINCQTYYYKVSAVNSVGEGEKSAEFSATPGTVPTAPQNFQSSLGDAYINLTWQAPASNGCNAITHYKVWRGTNQGNETLLADTGNKLWYNDTGLTNGHIYYYKVNAVNSIGNGPNSTEANATPATLPTAIHNLQTSLGDAYVNLTWLPPVENGGSAVTNYEVWRGTTSGAEKLLANASSVLWYNDTGLTNGVTYYYFVRAVNAQGPSPSSGEVNATPARTLIAPLAPQNLVVTAAKGQVTLSWNEPTTNGSDPLLGYAIFRGTSLESMKLLTTVTSTAYTDTGLTNDQVYYYQVCGYSTAGNGTMTEAISATPRGGYSSDLTIGMVIAAAAVDSINPCAISVMIFLLLFLTSLGNRRRVLLVGIAYIVTVFLVYFMAGVGLLTFLQSTAMTRYVYYGAAVLSIIIGLINIKDYFFPGNKPTVAIPESRKPLIKKYIEKASVPAAVVLGAMVSLFELPCTGGIYLAILSLVGDSMTLEQGIPYLALYNLIFVLPLAIILAVIYLGVSAEKANEWRLEKRSKLRLVVGLVMLVLGVVMLFGVV